MMMKIALLLTLSHGALGLDCNPGMKAVTTAGTMCTLSLTEDPTITTESANRVDWTKKSSCPACCQKDDKTCGGSASATCDTGFYWPSGTGLNAVYMAWQQKATTAATAKTDCCVAKTKCADITCKAPSYSKKASLAATVTCDGDDNSCAKTSPCCEKNPLICDTYEMDANLQSPCTGTKVIGGSRRRRDVNEYTGAVLNAQFATWKAKATTAASHIADCCIAAFTCKEYPTCPTGYKKLAAATDTTQCGKCTSEATADCANGEYDIGGCVDTCCEKEPDTTTCMSKYALFGPAPLANGCGTDKYFPATAENYYRVANAETGDKSNCCATKGTCADSYTCSPGKKKKTFTGDTAKDTKCAGDVTTCDSMCCEWNDLTCGGLAYASGTYKPEDFNCTTGYTPAKCPTGSACDSDSDSTVYIDSKNRDPTTGAITTFKWAAWMNKASTKAAQTVECCIEKSTCSVFAAAAAVSKTTGSALVAFSEQLRPGAAILLAVLAVVAGGQK